MWIWANSTVILSPISKMGVANLDPKAQKRPCCYAPVASFYVLHCGPGGIRVSQCVKSLKVYVFPPKSHYLGQACLKSAKILKINLNLDVPKVIQSYSTAVCSENSSQNSFWQKIIIPKLQITRTFNIFHYQGPNFEI